MEKFKLIEHGGFKRGQLIMFESAGKGRISRVGTLTTARHMIERVYATECPMLVISADSRIREAWMAALHGKPFTSLVVDYPTALRCLSGMDTARWVIVIDSAMRYAEASEQIREIAELMPRLVIGVVASPVSLDLDLDVVSEGDSIEPDSPCYPTSAKRASRISVPVPSSRFIITSMCHIHKVDQSSMVIVLDDAFGRMREWPQFAIHNNDVYERGDAEPLDQAMGAMCDIFGARRYARVSPEREQELSTNTHSFEFMKELLRALTFVS